MGGHPRRYGRWGAQTMGGHPRRYGRWGAQTTGGYLPKAPNVIGGQGPQLVACPR
jgi:hypothetical protein